LNRDRAWQEAERLDVLGQHPQIPTLIAVLESNRDLCLVQSYVPGQNLAQVLATEGQFDEVRVRSLLIDLLPVLQFIHNQGIIHRDIKPENILLPGEGRPPVLVDFGAARIVPDAPTLAQTGTVIGSPSYAAPEQVLGKAVPASDLYGLGVTCLHLLTGEHPFTLYSLAEDRWIWQPFVLQPVSPGLTRVLERLTARSLRSRYPTAQAALADLDPTGMMRVSASQPVPSGTVTSSFWRCSQIWETRGRVANAISISPSGEVIAVGNSDSSIQLWERSTGQLLHTWAPKAWRGDAHRDAVTTVSFQPDGAWLWTGSQDGTVKAWDLSTYRLKQTLSPPGWQVTAIALSPVNNLLIAGTADGHISLWDWQQMTQTTDLVRHTGAVSALAVTATGQRLVSAGEDGTLRLWSLPDGQLLHTWIMPVGLRAVGVSPQHSALVTGSADGQVIQWSLTNLNEKTRLSQHQDAVTALAFSPDGHWLATGSRDRTIHFWHWATPSPRYQDTLRHDWSVCAVVFTPDSRTLITSSADETIRLWIRDPAS
jgi:serine/threonine protein kinase